MDETTLTDKPADDSPAPAAIDWRALLISTFSLAPADGAESVSDEQIQAAFDTATAAGGEAGTQADDLQARLDETLAELEMKTSELDALKSTQGDAEIAALLEPYGENLDEAARATIGDLLRTNRDAGLVLLKAFPPAAPAASGDSAKPVEDAPPKPQHDPDAETDVVPDESAKIDEQNALVTEIRQEKRGEMLAFPGYDAARHEARRRKPELFV